MNDLFSLKYIKTVKTAKHIIYRLACLGGLHRLLVTGTLLVTFVWRSHFRLSGQVAFAGETLRRRRKDAGASVVTALGTE